MIYCHCKEDVDRKDALAIRIFGSHHIPVDRTAELIGIQLAHAAGCGTALVATFHNGFVTEYSHGNLIARMDYFKPHIAR